MYCAMREGDLMGHSIGPGRISRGFQRARAPSIILFVLLVQGGAVATFAQDAAPQPWTCLDYLDHAARAGSVIRVITQSGSEIEATYQGLTPGGSAVRLRPLDDVSSILDMQGDQIRSVKYRTSGHVQMKYALYGLVVGAAAGALIGAVFAEPSGGSGGMNFSVELNVGSGAVFGGLGGLILGPVVSIFVPHDHMISCTEMPVRSPTTLTAAAAFVVTMHGGERVGAMEVRARDGMLMLRLSDSSIRYVNPADVVRIASGNGEDKTRDVLERGEHLK